MINNDYAHAEYLIYSTFETKFSMSDSTIAGSLLIDSAMTMDEVTQKVEVYNSTLNDKSTSKIIYIANKKHWWSK